MNCRAVSRMLSSYLDRELPGEEMLEIREHVRSCTDCQAELEGIRRVKDSMTRLSIFEAPEGLEARLVAALDQPAKSRRDWFAAAGLVLASSVAAAVLAVVISGRFGPTFDNSAPIAGAPFDAKADQAYGAGPDSFGGHVPVLPASYPEK